MARCISLLPFGPKRDVSGSAWEGLDLPGPAVEGVGEGVAVTASFRFLAFQIRPVQLLTSFAERLKSQAVSALATGCGEACSFLSGPPPPFSAPAIQRPPNPNRHAHSPRHAPRAGGRRRRVPPPTPGKAGTVHGRRQFLVFPSFPVINSGGYKPVAAQDAPPAGSSLFLWALRGQIQDRWPITSRRAQS